jgi:hypothetical protein
MQLKAITMSLLRASTFELVDPPERYGPDYTKMVVQPRSRAGRYRAPRGAPSRSRDGDGIALPTRHRCRHASTSGSARGTPSACRRRPSVSGERAQTASTSPGGDPRRSASASPRA